MKTLVALIVIVLLAIGGWYVFTNGNVEEAQTPPRVAENPEGEADPSRMTLGMTTWRWIRAEMNDGRTITPKQEGQFTLKFESGRVTIGTDCNSMSANYTTGVDGSISFSEIISTKMYCEGSQEMEFSQFLENTSSYHFTSRGELILDLKFDSGSVIFR